MPNDRTKLIYIASLGRSGSTLLELLLGANPAVATTGEIHLWPHELRGNTRQLPCGCGLPVLECAFWAAMRERVDPLAASPPRIDHFREFHTHGKHLRLGRLRDFVSRSASPPSAEVDVYARNNDDVFRAFADLVETDTGTRPEWLVDASKDPYRLAWLARSGRFDLTLLQLVRDPRGFVNSERTNFDTSGLPLLKLAVTRSGAWVVENELVRRVGRSLPNGRYLVVRYEDLASDPATTMKTICDAVGCAFDPAVITGFRSMGFHAMGGNPMRHDERGITLDERWRRQLSPWSQRLAQAVTLPVRSRFGY